MEVTRNIIARNRGRSSFGLAVAGVLVVLMAVSAIHTAPTAHAATADVLILDSSVSGGSSSLEAQQVTALGLTFNIVNGTTWDSMTAADFAQYKAIVLGDPTCTTDVSVVQAAINNANVWEPAVTGSVVVIGTDAEFHNKADLIKDGINFAASKTGQTGAYIDLSCYYWTNGAFQTPVPLLSGFGAFTVQSATGCDDNAHIVSTSPALLGLNDAYLSNWSCSVHEGFDSWPSGWNPLAIDLDKQSTPPFVAPDGTSGLPYIFARGTTFNCASSDTDAPTITGTSITDVNGVRALQITVTDTNPSSGPATGLNDIRAYGTNLQVINSAGTVLGPISAPTTFVTIPGFLPTASTSYTFVAEKISAGSSASITVQAVDQCGNVADPHYTLKGKGLHGHRSADRKSVVITVDANA